VLAQVEPGEIRARLPASPPERGEAFADVLRDLDEILLPGVTHWQSPRFFAYFAVSASEPGILAELLAATLNSVAFIWRTSPASTELEALTLDWTAQLLGLPDGWHGHIEDTASTATLAAFVAARVTSVNEAARRFVIDAGAKMLGKDLADYMTGYSEIPELDGAVVARVADYHGIVDLPPGSPLPDVGRVVLAVPNHICPVVNHVDSFLVVRDGEIVDTWPVDARGRNG